MCQYHLLGFCKLSLSALNTEFNLLCCLCTSVLRKIISTKMKNIKTFEKLIKRISDRDRDRDIEGIGIKKNRNVSDGRTEKRKNETEIKMKGVHANNYIPVFQSLLQLFYGRWSNEHVLRFHFVLLSNRLDASCAFDIRESQVR